MIGPEAVSGLWCKIKMEQQQQQQGQTAPSHESQEPASQPSRSDNDDTWGLGSASALDYLRRRNFRGRRSPGVDDRPNAD